MNRASIAILTVLILPGCVHQIAISSLGGIVDTGFEVMNEEQDLSLAAQSIPSNLKLIETLLRNDPDNREYLLLASQGYASYALGFVEDDDPTRASEFYLRSREYGLRILRQHRRFARAETSNVEELGTALASFSKREVPAVFWSAIAWGSYISWNLTEPGALADLPRVEAMMRWVLDTDPTFFYGGPHFFLGTLYGSRPPMLGGNPDASRKHFEECLKINEGKFLMAHVYYARSYAVQTQNRELFDDLLTRVDTTSLDVLPEARLSNAIAKKKATLLKERVEELF